MSMKLETTQGPMTPGEIVDYLTYSCYRYNRKISPHITPEQWKKCFPNVDAMERRFQSECHKCDLPLVDVFGTPACANCGGK